jgi:hypothetical protein
MGLLPPSPAGVLSLCVVVVVAGSIIELKEEGVPKWGLVHVKVD